jgi:hypothetical protein
LDKQSKAASFAEDHKQVTQVLDQSSRLDSGSPLREAALESLLNASKFTHPPRNNCEIVTETYIQFKSSQKYVGEGLQSARTSAAPIFVV